MKQVKHYTLATATRIFLLPAIITKNYTIQTFKHTDPVKVKDLNRPVVVLLAVITGCFPLPTLIRNSFKNVV
jgi:hypothetical protein